MSAVLKFFKWLLLLLLLLVLLLLLYVWLKPVTTYDVPYPDIRASSDPAVIARGKHLFYGASHCAGCHAPESEYPKIASGVDVLPSGGEDFHLPFGILYTPNITSDDETGIGTYTDGEIARAIRYGVKRNGQAMFDLMSFYDISDKDLTALVSFLRSLPAVKNKRPEHDWNLLGHVLRAFDVFEPMGDGEVPDAPEPAPTAEYGKYLANSVANCRGCHTRRNLMTGAFEGAEHAGGMKFSLGVNDQGQGIYMITPNLTPDPATGRITDWSLAAFIQRFRIGTTSAESFMPWGQFKRMNDEELTALYLYFQSLDPVTADEPIPVGVQIES